MLEISAGGGAVVAIALMRAGAVVVATDADAEALKLHEENARANVEPDVFASRYRGALVLRWGDDPAAAISALGGSPDVVVASDVAYPGTRDAWPAFARTLVAVGAGARIIYGHASRYEAVDRRFFRVLREGGVRAERVDDGAVAGGPADGGPARALPGGFTLFGAHAIVRFLGSLAGLRATADDDLRRRRRPRRLRFGG